MNFVGCETAMKVADSGYLQCPSNWVVFTTDQLISELNSSDLLGGSLNAEEILLSFSWGFGVVVFFWSLGAVIGAAKKTINKL